MNFFRCRSCGATDSKIYISDAELVALLGECPQCEFDHYAEGYAVYPDDADALSDEIPTFDFGDDDAETEEAESNSSYANGDAVVGHDGADSVTGVVQEVYDDVVEILYFDRLSLTMETQDFHISQVEAYA